MHFHPQDVFYLISQRPILRQGISCKSIFYHLGMLNACVNNYPGHPTLQLARHSCAEPGRTGAERGFATVRGTHKRKGRLRPVHSARPRRPRHRCTGTC